MSRYDGCKVDFMVKFIGNFGGVSLTKNKVYHVIKESYKYGHRIQIESNDVGLKAWYKAIHFEIVL